MEKDRWGVIFSSKVGARRAYRHWLDIQDYMEKNHVKYDFVQSEGVGAVERLTKMLCENGYKTIVLVGNDASLNEALNAILSISMPDDFAFGLLPNGIGNDFARFWGRTEEEYKKSIDALIHRKTKRIDVGYCVYTDDSGIPYRRYFLNCINIGLGAKVVDTLDKSTRLTGSKFLSMVPAAITNIIGQKNFNVKMCADNENVELSALSICIGNARGYGQTPNAVPYNGLLDMSVIIRPEWWQLAQGFWLLSNGKFLNYKNVRPYRVEQVLMSDISKAMVTLDGLHLDVRHPAPMRIGLEREALNFII